MVRAFRSEWVKLRRRSMLIGGAAMTFFSLLFVPLALIRVTSPDERRGNGGLTRIVLMSDQGLTNLLFRGVTLTAVIALVLVASATAAEYAQGTLRNLLVRQPGRLQLLAGKFAALWLFSMIAATVSSIAGVVAALLTAPGRGIDTSAWFSPQGWTNLLSLYGNSVLAVTAYAVLGYLAAIALRSPAGAVGVPLAYILVVENLVAAIWTDSPQWLFGKLVGSVLQGQGVLASGADATSYTRGLLLGSAYVVLFVAILAVLFRRRDVST